jgi:hypothetical protein
MNKETSMFGRMCLLREWLKEQNPRITEAAIERKMGVATNYFKTRLKAPITDGEKGMRQQTIEKVRNAWATQQPETPALNMDWLVTGDGEMFLDKEETVVNEKNGTPYYDVDFLGGFDLLTNDQTIIPAYYIDFQPYNKKGNMWCNITGDSMSPRINSGDKICIREIRIEDIIYGEIYALVIGEDYDMRTVKWVTRSPEDGMIRLVPENKEPRYGDYQDMRIADIRKVFKVLGAVRSF